MAPRSTASRFWTTRKKRFPARTAPAGGMCCAARRVERSNRKTAITFFDRYPGLALYDVRFRNTGTKALTIAGWRVATHDLLDHPDGAWSFAGASYPDRRD